MIKENQNLLVNVDECIERAPAEIVSKQTLRELMLKGFSLIEIMVVVTLMAILIGLGTTYLMNQLERGKEQAARSTAYEIAKALDLYKLQHGSYPTVSEGLEVLVTPASGKPVLDELPNDPWKRPYNYAIPGEKNPKSFDVWSSGPDGNAAQDTGFGNWPE